MKLNSFLFVIASIFFLLIIASSCDTCNSSGNNCNPPSSLTVTDTSQTSATIEWPVVKYATGYRIKVTDVEPDTLLPAYDDITRSPKEGVIKTEIKGLLPSTEYEVSVTTICEDGEESQPSPSATFKTPTGIIIGDVVIMMPPPNFGTGLDSCNCIGANDYSRISSDTLLSFSEITYPPQADNGRVIYDFVLINNEADTISKVKLAIDENCDSLRVARNEVCSNDSSVAFQLNQTPFPYPYDGKQVDFKNDNGLFLATIMPCRPNDSLKMEVTFDSLNCSNCRILYKECRGGVPWIGVPCN